MKNEHIIQEYFAKLSFDPGMASVYAALHTHGPQSIAELSRTAHLERTRVYRLLEQLRAVHLVEVEARYKRNIIKAAPIGNVRMLIGSREQQALLLREELDSIEKALQPVALSSPATRIQFYTGQQGLRQMLWNELQATGEIVGYAHRIFEEGVGKKLILDWTVEFESRGLKARLLTSDEWATSWDKGLEGAGSGLRVGGMQYRHLPADVFAISYARDIYDDVVAYFQWKDHEVFGFEVYNLDIANAERQVFEIFWPQAKDDMRF